jgi:AcrR family transcriptional regulator
LYVSIDRLKRLFLDESVVADKNAISEPAVVGHTHGVAAETRQRLMDAAGEVFAEMGFRGASVREICQRARANIAAVNYHFGDKRRLYVEVLRYSHACAAHTGELQSLLAMPIPPAEKLHQFVSHFLLHVLDAGRPAWHGKLMAREMMEPTDALDDLVEYEIRPKFHVLRTIVAEVLGVPPEHPAVRWHAASVIGQCLFWHNNRAVIDRMYPDLSYDRAALEFLAEHVTRFSLAGLQGAGPHFDVYQRRDASTAAKAATAATGGEEAGR